ncbi:methyltransferase domain-containing protein [Colletotrichum cuscutae]|uniref:Methyltransferase domain-containing protein n=1 Tax=Colletotrichum cuscutae TaxID=1209917 RepID=A0AAI9UWZ6_9PEZI|nr:methyltransferase domain-containing protein [Colletotrichum cuscutae]
MRFDPATESDRLDFLHMLMVKTIGENLYLAPLELERIQRILDIGTGTGIWAILMGEEFPHAEIVGNDLSAIQPTWVPSNVKFEIDDVESPWVNSAKYDFIFCRDMAASLGDWPKLMRNIYAINREPNPGPKLEDWVRETGDYVNISHQKFKIPIGDWPKDPHYKECGIINMLQILDGLEAFTLRLFINILGWKKSEVLVLLAEVRNELKSGAFHAYFEYHVVYAQKPETLDQILQSHPLESGEHETHFDTRIPFRPARRSSYTRD